MCACVILAHYDAAVFVFLDVCLVGVTPACFGEEHEVLNSKIREAHGAKEEVDIKKNVSRPHLPS